MNWPPPRRWPPAPGESLPVSGEVPRGVPIVDLTALLADLYADADNLRAAALDLDRLAATHRRTADYLEALAGALSGGVRGE